MVNAEAPTVRLYLRERRGKAKLLPGPTKPGLGGMLLAALREGRQTKVAAWKGIFCGSERVSPPKAPEDAPEYKEAIRNLHYHGVLRLQSPAGTLVGTVPFCRYEREMRQVARHPGAIVDLGSCR